jgi:hypothetical protein
MTQTKVVSRHGASLECHHLVEIGETLLLKRPDTGTETRARVIWRAPRPGDRFEIGLEIQECDNFWEIDWSTAEPAFWQPDLASRQAH